MKVDKIVKEFGCIRCGKKVKMQVIGELTEKICTECWCKENPKEE